MFAGQGTCITGTIVCGARTCVLVRVRVLQGKFVVLEHVCWPGYVYFRGGKFVVLEHVCWPGYVYYRESLWC